MMPFIVDWRCPLWVARFNQLPERVRRYARIRLRAVLIGTPAMLHQSRTLRIALKQHGTEKRAVGRPRTDLKGFKNRAITGRDDHYPLAGLGSNPPPTPAGGLNGQMPGTDFQEPLDVRFRASVHRQMAGTEKQALHHDLNQRGRRASMRSFKVLWCNASYCATRHQQIQSLRGQAGRAESLNR